MRPIKTDECTFKYTLPGGTEQNDLHCIRDMMTRTVTSFWELEDDDHISDESGHLYVWMFGTADVPIEAAWADTLEGAEFQFQQVSADEDGDGCVTITIGEKERDWLRSGGSLALRVHAIPIPPLGMNLSTYSAPAA